LRHSYVGTEHLLLGLLRVDDGRAAATLASLGVPMEVIALNAKLLRDQSGNNLYYNTNSITLDGIPGIRFPQQQGSVGWTKTMALRRFNSSNTGAKAGSPGHLSS